MNEQPKKTIIVIPTYNERENISRILPEVLAVDGSVEVLVVDDNSPDGTGEIVAGMAEKTSRVHLLQRAGKMGLGSAYRDGFAKALEMGADYVMEMDADFSHDPKYIHDFLRMIEVSDVVLGSRYQNGVNVINWPISRLILSYSANLYTRIVTGMPILDATGGFKCFRREVLEAIDYRTSRSDGYSFQIELNFRCWRQGYRIREIPIVFIDRHSGTSKMSKKIMWEAVWMVWRLRLGSLFSKTPTP